MNLENSRELHDVIRRCLVGDRKAQQTLFSLCYPLSMNVCRRYANDLGEAKSLVNEGMFKVFKQLDRYSMELSFGGWLRRIMVNTAIDYYRKEKIFQERFKCIQSEDYPNAFQEDVLDSISAEELLALVQDLPPAYRIVFSLYAVEEYTHKEIADYLGISEGTSKSNYAKARTKLQKALETLHSSNGNKDDRKR